MTQAAPNFLITGLPSTRFEHLFGLSDAELAQHGACRRIVGAKPGFPCRVSLEDAEIGEPVILLNHESHSVGPFRQRHAIYVRERLAAAARFENALPPVFEQRTLSLRGYSEDGMLAAAALAEPGRCREAIEAMLGNPDIDHIDVHNALPGCFAARVDRNEGQTNDA